MNATYITTDMLNPNAVNPRYGRPAVQCDHEVVAQVFLASSDDGAWEEFESLIEDGFLGYSERNQARVSPRLYRLTGSGLVRIS